MQRDPKGYIDGINRYAYVRNNPVNRIDPNGTVSIGTNNHRSLNSSYHSGSGSSSQTLASTNSNSNLSGNVQLTNTLGFGDRIGNAFNSLAQAGQNVVNSVTDFAGAVGRAADFERIGSLANRAFSTDEPSDPIYDPVAHERSAHEYGRYIDNPVIAKIARTVGEIGQFLGYGAEVISGGHLDILPGEYNPFTRRYLQDAASDIQITVNGAEGLTLEEALK